MLFFLAFQPIIYLYKIIDILLGFHGLIILKIFFNITIYFSFISKSV